VLLSAITLAIFAQSAAAQDACGPWRTVEQITIDDEAWHWNWASWDQDKIVSVGDFQYTVYWDADKALVLVRRNLKTNDVERLRMDSFKLSADDAHRNTCLGVSMADGRLHLSWDHHNNPLRYTRSRAGFLTGPPKRIEATDFEPPQPIGDEPKLEARVTYPRFFNDAGGDLFLEYRLGSSGAGENYLHRYDAESGRWTRLGKLFSSRGTYGPWNNSRTRNAYLHDLLFDGRNRLHASWVYRETGASWASNHDLHYAYSDDAGLTWRNNAGATIADLPRGDAIELADPGIVVRAIPVHSWLINAGCMAIDSKNRPHVVTYKLESTRRPAKLTHSPPREFLDQLRFVHYWRSTDGVWWGGEPIEDAESVGTPRRGDVVIDRQDNLYFFYHPRDTHEGFRCLSARAADQWRQWTGYQLTSPPYIGLDASKHDRRRWQEQGILSFTAMIGPTGFGILEMKLDDNP
jgi:hypothetical protein